jgi:hypothetical protein
VGTCDGLADKHGYPLPESECPGFDLTDEDAYYQIVYKHTGKPATYLIYMILPAGEDWSSYCYDADVWDCSYTYNGQNLCVAQEELKGNEFTELYLELYEIGDPEAPANCTAVAPPL